MLIWAITNFDALEVWWTDFVAEKYAHVFVLFGILFLSVDSSLEARNPLIFQYVVFFLYQIFSSWFYYELNDKKDRETIVSAISCPAD